MALEKEGQKLKAFITWRKLLLGLESAPGAFQNLMELTLLASLTKWLYFI